MSATVYSVVSSIFVQENNVVAWLFYCYFLLTSFINNYIHVSALYSHVMFREVCMYTVKGIEINDVYFITVFFMYLARLVHELRRTFRVTPNLHPCILFYLKAAYYVRPVFHLFVNV